MVLCQIPVKHHQVAVVENRAALAARGRMASEQPTSLSPQNIKLKGQLQAVGAVPFFEKCLTSSDTGAHGRVVLPKVRM